MPDKPTNPAAESFGKDRYIVSVEDGRRFSLEPPDDVSAKSLGTALSRIDPWLTLGIGAEAMTSFLTRKDHHCFRHAIRHGDALVGVVAVRNPWLYGPYLNLLAILPAYQHSGVGAAVLQWMAAEAGETASNLWVCVSKFNPRALRFYERHGFQFTAELPGLVKPAFTELLLRKQLAASG